MANTRVLQESIPPFSNVRVVNNHLPLSWLAAKGFRFGSPVRVAYYDNRCGALSEFLVGRTGVALGTSSTAFVIPLLSTTHGWNVVCLCVFDSVYFLVYWWPLRFIETHPFLCCETKHATTTPPPPITTSGVWVEVMLAPSVCMLLKFDSHFSLFVDARVVDKDINPRLKVFYRMG